MHDSYLSSTATVQASIEKMNTILSNACKPSISVVQQNLTQSLLGFQQQISTITYPQFNFAVQMQAQLDALTAPIRQMQEILSASLVSGIRDSSAVNKSILEQTKILQESMSSFASAFQGITIHENYVSVPEILIPEDFQYEEVSDTSSINSGQNEDHATNTKNLSLSDTLTLLNLLTMILVFLLTPFYNHAIENTLSEKAEAKSSVPITEEQAQQMLDYLSELTDYQQAILTAFETSHRSVQESVSVPSDIDLTPSGTYSTLSNADSQHVPSQSDPVDESHPTEVDDSENSEQH